MQSFSSISELSSQPFKLIRQARLKILGVLALAACVPGYASTDFNGTSIPIPAGLVQGDTFQLVFVTFEDYVATSTTISTYNTDVTTSANKATSLVDGLGITWSALVSTASTNVLSNIVDTSPSTPGFAGVYDLGGNFIADGTDTTPVYSSGGEGLYSGNLQNLLNTDEYSATVAAFAWTGTASNGTPLDPLGSASVLVGEPNNTLSNDHWTDFTTMADTNSERLYAISNVLTLGPNNTLEVGTPEPATIGTTLLGLVSSFFAARRKRAVKQASQI